LRIEIASQCPLNHHRGYEVGRYQKRLTDIVCPRVGCIEAQPLRVGGLEVWILASPRAVSFPAKDRGSKTGLASAFDPRRLPQFFALTQIWLNEPSA
jgi:hypothetical protein